MRLARLPSAAADADRLMLDARPGKAFEIKAASHNRKTLEKLRDVIGEIDRIYRKNLGDGDDPGRLRAIAADPKIDVLLLEPLKRNLVRNGIGADGVEAFGRMIDQQLLALCDRQIISIETGLNLDACLNWAMLRATSHRGCARILRAEAAIRPSPPYLEGGRDLDEDLEFFWPRFILPDRIRRWPMSATWNWWNGWIGWDTTKPSLASIIQPAGKLFPRLRFSWPRRPRARGG